MIDLAQRRALLRSAAEAADTGGFADLASALLGADEEERRALTKTLPPTRLLRSEGYTPRAVFAVTALGAPLLAAESLVPQTERQRRERAAEHDRMTPVVQEAALGRSDEWVTAFVPEFAARSWWTPDLVWNVCRELTHRRGVGYESLSYLSLFLRQLTGDFRSAGPEQQGKRIAQHLRDTPSLIDKEFWALFRVEDMGSSSLLNEYGYEGWDFALTALCQEDPRFRARLLDESLAALLRDFSSKALAWYLRLHRALAPQASEVAQRQGSYLTLLGTEASTAVTLAQDMLRRGLPGGDIDESALIDASAAVLGRSEKKLIRAQLRLLKDIAAQGDAAQRDAIGDLLDGFIDILPPELSLQARRLTPNSTPSPDLASPPEISKVTVAEPIRTRRSPLPETAFAVIDGEDEAREAVARQLEGTGSGAELPQLLAYLSRHPESAFDATLIDRAAAIFSSQWDLNDASPRRHLATLLGERAGREGAGIDYRGFRRHVYLREGESFPADWDVRTQQSISMTLDEDGEWVERETHRFQSGYRFISTHAPSALLVRQFRAAPQTAPLAPVERAWQRVLAVPGEGVYGYDSVTDDSPKPTWIVSAAGAEADDGFVQQALDVAPVAEEFTFRVHESREQDGYEQIAEWAAWLLQHNPDTLAAHFHPTFWIATQVVNVRGIAPLLTALGSSARAPGGPTYSALALLLSAKEAAHRAHAAETVAQLCASGLLDPEPFATQIAAHLSEGFVMAGRLAASLADAATINAISGYRVLQVVAALFPALTDENGKPITQTGKLIEVAARLSEEYGSPVPLPAALRARRKGSSAMAVAIRALEDVRAQPTDLLREAAAHAADPERP